MQALVTVILLYSLVGQQKSSLPIESIKKEGKEASQVVSKSIQGKEMEEEDAERVTAVRLGGTKHFRL